MLAPIIHGWGFGRMSGVDQIHTLTRQYSYHVSRPDPVCVGVTYRVKGGFLLIHGLNRRYMPRCVGNLNNQG